MGRRVIPNLYITLHENASFDSIQDNFAVQEVLFANVILGIKEATRYKHKEATIVELNSSGNYITLPRENWKSSLEKAQDYFVKLEKYEICASVQKLIESINSYGSTRVYRKTSRANKPNYRNKEYSKTS
jgi:hypothetical protein